MCVCIHIQRYIYISDSRHQGPHAYAPTRACTIYNKNQHVTRTQDTPTEKTPPTPAHTRARQDPQTNTSHKHLTTLNGGATTVRATSHARVGGRADIYIYECVYMRVCI